MLGLQDSIITFAREGGKDVLRGDDGLGVSRGGRQCEIISCGWRSRCGFGCGCGCGCGFRSHHHRHSLSPHQHTLRTLRASCSPWSLRQMRGNRARGRQTPHHCYKFPSPPLQDSLPIPPTSKFTQNLAADSTANFTQAPRNWDAIQVEVWRRIHQLRDSERECVPSRLPRIEREEREWNESARCELGIFVANSRSREDNVGHSSLEEEIITNA